MLFHHIFSLNHTKRHPRYQNGRKPCINALEENKTWIVTELPLGKTSIGCRWVYKLKFNIKGEIERHKARLVLKGYT